MKNQTALRFAFWLMLIALFVITAPVHADALAARNIILMIGDGMGPVHMQLYDLYARRILKTYPAFSELMDLGSTGFMQHSSASGLVTDSAAGATAFSCGIKTLNGRVAMDADGNTYPTLLEIAKKNGKKTGIVTNIPPYDATESSFLSHAKSRNDYDTIIPMAFNVTQPDVLLGTAFPGGVLQTSSMFKNQGPIDQLAQRNGYQIVRTIPELKAANPVKKIYGVLDVQTPYIDFPAPSERTSVTLSEITSVALDQLANDNEGFFMMIEGAKIDKNAHPNDAASVMREMEEFDKTIAVALDFAHNNPDTLIIVTADHETGGMSIVGGNDESLRTLGMQSKPLSVIREELGDAPGADRIKQAFRTDVGVELNDAEVEELVKNWAHPDRVWGNILTRFNQVHFNTNGHSATPVALFGYGPGSEGCSGWRENTDVFDIIMTASGMIR
ncbi:MAG: hypothetical protein GC154_00590 [bacterium]|nr:hypothetical protein [bacterium]